MEIEEIPLLNDSVQINLSLIKKIFLFSGIILDIVSMSQFIESAEDLPTCCGQKDSTIYAVRLYSYLGIGYCIMNMFFLWAGGASVRKVYTDIGFNFIEFVAVLHGSLLKASTPFYLLIYEIVKNCLYNFPAHIHGICCGELSRLIAAIKDGSIDLSSNILDRCFIPFSICGWKNKSLTITTIVFANPLLIFLKIVITFYAI